MSSLRWATHRPTEPRRSKLAASAAITQSNFEPRFGLWMMPSGSRKSYFCGMRSSFQQVTFFPSFRRARVRPSCEPTQSPSGRMWPAIQNVWLCLMPSMMRSIIFGCGFIGFSRAQAWRAPEGAGSGACRVSCVYSAGSAGAAFSSSSMIPSTRLPRAIESSIRNRSVGVYFRTTARPTKP